MDATLALNSTSKSAVDATQMSFFDLPPELRNRIYFFLFKGKEIAIRHVDTTTTWKESGALVVKRWISRDREAGTNIIFASKATLAEARPMLLGLASFDLKSSHLFPTSTLHPQVQQGFGYAEFQSTHSLVFPDLRLISYFFQRMPCLHAVSIHDSTAKTSGETLNQFKSQCGRDRDGFLEALGSSWRRQEYNEVLKRLKDRAESQNLQPHFLVGSRTKFKGRGAKVWVWMEAVKETIWVTDTEDKKVVLVPERREPGLLAALNNGSRSQLLRF